MVIKSDKSNFIEAGFMLVLVLLAVGLIYSVGGAIPAIVLFILCLIVLALNCITIGKTIIFHQLGCKVKFWKYEREYTWEELSIKRIEPPHLGLRMPYHSGGAFFSKSPVRKPKILDPTLYCSIFHPFSCIYVYFVREDRGGKQKGTPGVYEVNKEAFLFQLKAWGVDLDN